VNANLIVSSNFNNMQYSLPSDVYLQLQYWLDSSDTFSDFFTVDTTATPGNNQVQRREDLIDTVSWTSKVFNLGF